MRINEGVGQFHVRFHGPWNDFSAAADCHYAGNWHFFCPSKKPLLSDETFRSLRSQRSGSGVFFCFVFTIIFVDYYFCSFCLADYSYVLRQYWNNHSQTHMQRIAEACKPSKCAIIMLIKCVHGWHYRKNWMTSMVYGLLINWLHDYDYVKATISNILIFILWGQVLRRIGILCIRK